MLWTLTKANLFFLKSGGSWDIILKLNKNIVGSTGFLTLALFFEKLLIEVYIKYIWLLFFQFSFKSGLGFKSYSIWFSFLGILGQIVLFNFF